MSNANKIHGQSSENAGDWTVRRGSIVDLRAIWALAEAVPTTAHWRQEIYRTFLVPEEGESGTVAKVIFVACDCERQEILGFAAFQSILATGECGLENMAVDEKWRRNGIGKRLLDAGFLWGRGWRAAVDNPSEKEDNIRLEVRASNRAAIEFYLKAGFVEVGRRSGYYAQPVEDGLLMSKDLYR